MKMTKKVLSAIALAAMVTVTAIPVTTVQAAVSPVAAFDFENGTGMSASSIAGSTAPTVVNDSDRGNVLKFAQGTSSDLLGPAKDSKLGEYDQRIEPGTPSSLKFTNPYKGKSLTGISIAYWVKVPSEEAALKGSGIVGFVSGNRTIEHPDKLLGDPAKQGLSSATGPFMFGATLGYEDSFSVDGIAPTLYFAGLHHNTYNYHDMEGEYKKNLGTWKYTVVTMTNSAAVIYVDGKVMNAQDTKNKRWNDGEINGGSKGNVGQPKLLDFIAWEDTLAYVGYTGFSPTYEGVCIDDLLFFDKALSAAEATALYNDAKAGNVDTSSTGGSSSSTSSADKAAAAAAAQKAAEEAAAAAAAAEAAAVEANKNLTNAVLDSVQVAGMPSSANKTVTGIFRGDSAYTALQSKVNGVTLRDGYRMANLVGMDISFGGVQPEGVATITMSVPNGFDTSKMEVVRVNNDGTVSILNYTIENGKIVTKTSHFSTFAVVQLEAGVYTGSSSSNLPKTGVVSAGIVVALGTVSVTGGAILLRKKKETEE